jgi:hypothetical protein
MLRKPTADIYAYSLHSTFITKRLTMEKYDVNGRKTVRVNWLLIMDAWTTLSIGSYDDNTKTSIFVATISKDQLQELSQYFLSSNASD